MACISLQNGGVGSEILEKNLLGVWRGFCYGGGQFFIDTLIIDQNSILVWWISKGNETLMYLFE